MAIYHCSVSNVSRAKGSSACATLSYISAEKVYEERTGQTYSYGRGERVIAVGTIIPEYAPKEYENPSTLFNSIENYEKAENARIAKKIEVALPRELDLSEQKQIVEDYIRNNLTSEGYCATYAIHNDKENNNPHAHILVANRPVNEKGEWSSKRKMEYVLDENGERIPRLDENGQQKTDKNGRKQWVRINAEQNPLDKKAFLEKLRAGWAEECNRHLDADQQIDHRSYADQGIDLIPTIHEGYASRETENKGGVSERAEINREIKEKNQLIRQLSAQLKEMSAKLIERGSQAFDRIGELLQRSRHSREIELGCIRAGKERRDQVLTPGRDSEIDNGETGSIGGETESFIRKLNAQERTAEEKRRDSFAQRAARDAEHERQAVTEREEREREAAERESRSAYRNREMDGPEM